MHLNAYNHSLGLGSLVIQVSASTSVGPGQPSPTRQIETKQSVPRPPANITSDRSSRNVSCVKLQWSHEDISNGNITGYNVSKTYLYPAE
jgi:hypothetical protein